jgi:hypothetical protein
LEKISVVVQIAGKDYPMKVVATDEPRVREAAQQLATQIESYKNFGIIEKQDLLAMVAFDSIFSKLALNEQKTQLIDGVCAEIEALAGQLDG